LQWQPIIIEATCVFIAAMVWQRRWTLFLPFEDAKIAERTITLSMILQLTTLLLRTPLADDTVGYLLHAITGQWNLNMWASDCCCLGAAAVIGVNIASRLNISIRALRAGFRAHFELPMTIVAPVLLALIVKGPSADLQSAGAVFDTPDRWLDAYWTVFCGYLAYLLYTVCRALMIIRTDERNRRTADIYLAALMPAIIICGLRIIAVWFNVNCEQGFCLAGCAISAVISYAAARSWRQKIRWLAAPPRVKDGL
jgi:hypothetical protein